MHQAGIARLKEWGLLDALIASNCPPITRFHFDFGAFALSGSPPAANGVVEAYAPRRKVLDALLAKAAVAAGAELREGFSVQDVLWDTDTVTGIRGRRQGGDDISDTARMTIGADGMHSLIARAAHAPRGRHRCMSSPVSSRPWPRQHRICNVFSQPCAPIRNRRIVSLDSLLRQCPFRSSLRPRTCSASSKPRALEYGPR